MPASKRKTTSIKRATRATGRSAKARPARDNASRIKADIEKLQRKVDELRRRVQTLNGHGREMTILERWEKAGLIGCIKDAPPDLSTNPNYMEGFGES